LSKSNSLLRSLNLWRTGLGCLILLVGMAKIQANTLPTATAAAGTWRPSATAFGRVSATRRAVLRLPFAARILAFQVEPGEQMAAGAGLARLDIPELRKQLVAWHQASREAALAQQRVEVLRQSLGHHVITRADFLAAQEQRVRSRAKARLAWEGLSATLARLAVTPDRQRLEASLDRDTPETVAHRLGILKAPFAGVVSQRPATAGEILEPGSAILELKGLERVYVEVGIPASGLTLWRQGETYWQERTTTILKRLTGEPRYQAATGLWLLRFETANPDRSLRDGMWIRVRHLGTPRSVVWVPAAAVAARNGRTWCIVRRGDRLEPVQVQAGPGENGRIPILSGLPAGERVVTEGAYELLYRDLKELIRFED